MNKAFIERMESLKLGDTYVGFMAREETAAGGKDIDGAYWFEPEQSPPGFIPASRTFADGMKEIYRLRDRYLEEFPNLHVRMDKGQGIGALFLPCKNGRTIVLGFRANVITGAHFKRIQKTLTQYRRLTRRFSKPEGTP